MATTWSNGPSPLSSRSVSPEIVSERPYDPFLDPVELSHLPRTSHETKGRFHEEIDRDDNTYNFQKAPSPSASSLRNMPSGSYFPAPRGGDGASFVDSPQPGRGRFPTQSTWGGTASLYSLGSLNHYKTMDVDTQALVDKRVGEIAQWNIHWITPAIIVVLFVAGLLAALGHHVFYARLNGKLAPGYEQLKMIRYGTALAFFVKSTLVGCIIMCYRQRIWHTFRTKALSMQAIDGLFAATEDPTHFVRWEMIKNAKLATFLAACSWLIPIASVLSPASLTSESRVTSLFGEHCPSVATLNFTHESLYDYRNVNNFPGASLIFLNTTDTTAKTEGWFDYWDQPSKNARRLTVTAAYLRKPNTNAQASIESCGQGWNCTYNLNFQAPGYKCEEPGPNDVPAFNVSMLAPEGNNTYYSDVDVGDYANPQIDSENGVPIQKPPYPDSLGVFESEPILWIGYSLNTSKPYDKDSPYADLWHNVHEPKIFKCTLMYTDYTFNMTYEESLQSAKLVKRDFLRPLLDDGPVSPRDDVEKYKLTATYHALGALLRNFMRGSILYKTDAKYFVSKSDISETRLIDVTTSYVVPNLMNEVQSFYEDMIVTLLSEPFLVVADKQNVTCDKSRRQNVYVYHAEGLWVGYAIAVAVAFASIFVGAWSIFQNGVSSDIQFSRIMVTTRNPTLDRLSVGACLGGDPFPKELTQTKLRFGVLLEDDPREGPLGKVEHCCFGAVGEVKEIVKNGTYAGLKKWRKTADEETGYVDEKRALLEKCD